MNSRERVLAALNHKQPDRIPVDCGGHRSSGFSVQAYKNLRAYLGLPQRELYIYDLIQQLAYPDDDIIELFGLDVLDFGRGFMQDAAYWKDWQLQDGTPIKIPAFVDIRKENGGYALYNADGVMVGIQKEGCLYFEQTCFALEHKQDEDYSTLAQDMNGNMWCAVGLPPAPLGFEGADREKRIQAVNALRASTDKALYGIFGGSLYENGGMLFGLGNFIADMAGEPEKVNKFLDALTEVHLQNLKLFLDTYGSRIDVLGFSDDLGMQTGPQMSPKMYRELFKPRHEALFRYAKQHSPNIKLCMHCCGGIEPLLPDIIDAGMDAINPVQISCEGMDLKTLKAKYGKDLTFWGGGCDTRTILPEGTPQQVKDHVKQNLEIMFQDGGFVFQQVHNILGNVPPQNIVAMFEAVKEF